MSISVALLQFGAEDSKEFNIEKARSFLEHLISGQQSPELVCLPEMFPYLPDPADDFEAIDRVAEEVGGPITQLGIHYADRLGAYVLLGSFLEKDGGRHFNTSLLIAPNGEIVARYRKIHLFDIADYQESRFFEAGDEAVVAETSLGKIGLTICYDLRFPELFRTLSIKGAEIVICPAAFPVGGNASGYDHWQILTQAAALQNMVYLIAVNQIGYRNPFYYFGRSVVIDPWGIEIAKAGNQPCIVCADMDLEYLRQMRQARRPLQHRRPETYSL